MKSLVFISFLFLANSINAQFDLIDKEILRNIKGKKLLVELKSYDTETLSEIDEESKENFLKFNSTFNEAIKEILPENWKLSDGEIEFKTKEEINKIANTDIEKCILFHSGWMKKKNKLQGSFLMYSFNIEHFNANGKRENIFELTYMPDEIITKADILFVLKVLNNHVDASKRLRKYSDYFNVENNIYFIEQKSLLLDTQLTKLNSEDISKFYSTKFEIVTFDKIATEIENSNPDFFFIRMVWSNTKDMAMYNAFDTKDCHIKSCIGTGGLKVDLVAKTPKYQGSGGTSNFYDANRYPYRIPGGGKVIFSVQLYKSKLLLKKIHLKTMFSKGGQKLNCK